MNIDPSALRLAKIKNTFYNQNLCIPIGHGSPIFSYYGHGEKYTLCHDSIRKHTHIFQIYI